MPIGYGYADVLHHPLIFVIEDVAVQDEFALVLAARAATHGAASLLGDATGIKRWFC